MEGLAAIGSRIAEINAQLSRLSAPAAAPATAPATATSSARPTASTTTANTTATGSTAAPSFDDALATALTAASTTGGAAKTGTTQTFGTNRTATSVTATSGKLTSSGVPVELAKYGNGRVPAAALESIGGGHRLWAPAAEAFQRLRAAAHRAGVSIGVTDSYRSYAEQVDVARRKGLHSQGGLAARPGTSEHGWGKSLDLDLNASAQRWMRSHAGEFGFSENVSREPWHWTYAAR